MDVSTSGAVASTASAGSEKKSRAAPSSDRRFGDDWIHMQPASQRRETQTGQRTACDPGRKWRALETGSKCICPAQASVHNAVLRKLMSIIAALHGVAIFELTAVKL